MMVILLLAALPAARAAVVIDSISTVMPDGKRSVPESVYDWQTEHCATGRPLAPCSPAPCHATPYQRDVPDAPAMAWRDPVSNLTYVAAGDSRGTWPSIGSSLDTVEHDCSSMIFNYSGQSGYLQPASAFSSHEWLYAPYVVPPIAHGANATLYMLTHNEFHGWEHAPELCNATRMVDGRCWYNSVGMSTSHDGGRTIRHIAPPPMHLVAASPETYAPNFGPYGVFSPSQIVKFKGWLYSFPRCRSRDGRTAGVCIMRIQEKNLDDPKAWRFWQGGGEESFGGEFTDPYTQTGAAIPATIHFGDTNDTAQPSQPVPRFLPQQGLFLMIGYANMPTGHGPGGHFGWSIGRQPWGPWSRLNPISGVDANPTEDEGNAIRGLYPSLLDPNSPSLNYDTIVGDTAYLYWTQGRNKTAVGALDMARDVWRQKVRIVFKDE